MMHADHHAVLRANRLLATIGEHVARTLLPAAGMNTRGRTAS